MGFQGRVNQEIKSFCFFLSKKKCFLLSLVGPISARVRITSSTYYVSSIFSLPRIRSNNTLRTGFVASASKLTYSA